MGLARSTYYARSRSRRAARDSTLRAAIEAVLVQWSQYGYRRVTKELVTLHIAPSDQEDCEVAALAALRPQITEHSPRYFSSTRARVHTTIVTHDCNARANSAGTVDLE